MELGFIYPCVRNSNEARKPAIDLHGGTSGLRECFLRKRRPIDGTCDRHLWCACRLGCLLSCNLLSDVPGGLCESQGDDNSLILYRRIYATAKKIQLIGYHF